MSFLGVAVAHLNISPSEFWPLGFEEFYSIYYTKFPNPKLDLSEFQTEYSDYLELLEKGILTPSDVEKLQNANRKK